MGLAFADYDNDGFTDVFVSTDTFPIIISPIFSSSVTFAGLKWPTAAEAQRAVSKGRMSDD
jgi:hypothetical protein